MESRDIFLVAASLFNACMLSVSSFLPHGYALLPAATSPSFSLTCLMECSTLLFTNEDLYIFLLIAAFLCISRIKSQNVFNILYIKNSFSFFALVRPDPSDIFLGCSVLKVDKSRGIIISQQEMLKCVVGGFKAYCKTCKKVLLFVISAQTASVTVLKNICALRSTV